MEGGGRNFLSDAAGSLLDGALSPGDGDRGGVLLSSSLAPPACAGDGDRDRAGSDGPGCDDSPRAGCVGDDGPGVGSAGDDNLEL